MLILFALVYSSVSVVWQVWIPETREIIGEFPEKYKKITQHFLYIRVNQVMHLVTSEELLVLVDIN